MIDYEKFQKSLKHLELQYQNYQGIEKRTDLGELDKEAIEESVIQRFETCYDCLWKVLKRYLTEEAGLADAPSSPKPILRLAFENNLLKAGIEQWLKYANARIDTSHDYSGEKAQETLLLMKGFISDAIDLYTAMTGKTWE